MKYLLLYILPLLSFSEYSKNDITKITIARVSFYINSLADVNCHDFDRELGPKDTITITDTKRIKFLYRQLLKSKECENFPMDARAKMLIYHKTGKTDSACIDSRKFELNGRSRIFENDSLVNWIEDHPYQRH